MLAILAGLSAQQQKRVRIAFRQHAVAVRRGWDLEFVPASGMRAGIGERQVRHLTELASDCGAAHVLAFSQQDGANKKRVREEIGTYFRLVWMPSSLLSLIGSDIVQFVTAINAYLEQEEEWEDVVMPQDTRSPLLLPERSFNAALVCKGLWTQARAFGDKGNIRAAANAITRFQDNHWRRTAAGRRCWTDELSLVFDHSGPRHGQAPHPREWKYSFRIPDGFHYDVAASDGRGFRLCDVFGLSHSVAAGRHVNMDPHGYVI